MATGGSVTEAIGRTPLVRLEHAHFKSVEIWAKLEYLNPGGAVKDRAALGIINDGERSGRLTRDKVILDATSGNTGIAYAMIGAARGYKVELVLPENVSEERKRTVLAYGARVRYSSPYEGSDGAIRMARELAARNPDRYFYADQYNNPANWKMHYRTTGVELWRQTRGRITHFVACVGTSGTLMGTGRRLKRYNPAVRVVEVQPEEALHGIEGVKHMASSIVPTIYDPTFADQRVLVKTEDAYEMTRLLARMGYFVGYSSGAALKAALRVAAGLERGVIVIVFPDSGERYLSTHLWETGDDLFDARPRS
jgi:cysteine synthase B